MRFQADHEGLEAGVHALVLGELAGDGALDVRDFSFELGAVVGLGSAAAYHVARDPLHRVGEEGEQLGGASHFVDHHALVLAEGF